MHQQALEHLPLLASYGHHDLRVFENENEITILAKDLCFKTDRCSKQSQGVVCVDIVYYNTLFVII